MRSPFFVNWLDIKLGGRMLVKYPGLTVVGGLAMAFAILVGIVIFQFAHLFLHPSLPFANGDRIVQVSLQDVASNQVESRALMTSSRGGSRCGPSITSAPGAARPVT